MPFLESDSVDSLVANPERIRRDKIPTDDDAMDSGLQSAAVVVAASR